MLRGSGDGDGVGGIVHQGPIRCILPAGGGPAAVTIQTERIADGLWFLNSGAPQSLLVEFSDHVVIIEAPTSDARTLATIAEAKRMFSAKPMRAFSDENSRLQAHSGHNVFAAPCAGV